MIFEIIVLLLAIPTGFLIAALTPEELYLGQKYFKAIILLAIITGVFFFIEGETYIVWTSGFVIIVTLFSIKKFLFTLLYN